MTKPLNTLLIIGYVWPEPNSSAAGTRMMQLIQLFKEHDWHITFASPAKQGEHKENLSVLGIHEVKIELNDESFDRFVTELSPNLVIFDRFMMEEQFGWRVEAHAPHALRILNTEDLHSLRTCRQLRLKSELKHLKKRTNSTLDLTQIGLTDLTEITNQMKQTELAQREIASIFRSDLTLMISKVETQFLETTFQVPQSQLFYLPFQYDKKDIQQLPLFEQRNHFVTIGNFRHDPNWDSVLWLKESIWPKIKTALPDAQLHIYGAYPPPKATALNNPKQGFLVKGWAKDAHEVIQNAKVLLAPLRFGAGIKGKLAEAMINGTPSVTTPIGAEAMYQEQNETWPGAISQTAEDFAQQAINLYQNQDEWLKQQQQGYKVVSREFIKTIDFTDAFLNQIETILGDLDSHRNQHFIGAMLNHHYHKSTKYMAQWIEAKNKLS